MIVDAGPLISADRNRRAIAALMAAAIEAEETLRTTQAIVAQVWRNPRQANLAAALAAIDVIDDFGDGRRVGELLAASGTNDAIDAHLAILARRVNESVLTADTEDFAKLAAVAGFRVVEW